MALAIGGLAVPLLLVVGSQLGAAYVDHSLRWGTLVAIAFGVYHVWRESRLERRQSAALKAARHRVPARDPWPDYWPPEWRRRSL